MATRTVTDRDDYTIVIYADSSGPRSGVVHLSTTDGRQETQVTIGAAGADVVFGTLGTAAQRAAFLAIIELCRAAARTKLGYA